MPSNSVLITTFRMHDSTGSWQGCDDRVEAVGEDLLRNHRRGQVPPLIERICLGLGAMITCELNGTKVEVLRFRWRWSRGVTSPSVSLVSSLGPATLSSFWPASFVVVVIVQIRLSTSTGSSKNTISMEIIGFTAPTWAASPEHVRINGKCLTLLYMT